MDLLDPRRDLGGRTCVGAVPVPLVSQGRKGVSVRYRFGAREKEERPEGPPVPAVPWFPITTPLVQVALQAKEDGHPFLGQRRYHPGRDERLAGPHMVEPGSFDVVPTVKAKRTGDQDRILVQRLRPGATSRTGS